MWLCSSYLIFSVHLISVNYSWIQSSYWASVVVGGTWKVWADTAPGPATAQPPAGKSRAAPGGDEETSSSQEAAAQRTVVTREPVCETQWGGGHQVTVAFINPQFWFSSRGRGLHLHRHTHCKFCLYCFLSASSYLERILNNRALTT